MLHLSPRDVDQLTVVEYDQLSRELDAYMRELKRQHSEAEARARAARGGRR